MQPALNLKAEWHNLLVPAMSCQSPGLDNYVFWASWARERFSHGNGNKCCIKLYSWVCNQTPRWTIMWCTFVIGSHVWFLLSPPVKANSIWTPMRSRCSPIWFYVLEFDNSLIHIGYDVIQCGTNWVQWANVSQVALFAVSLKLAVL